MIPFLLRVTNIRFSVLHSGLSFDTRNARVMFVRGKHTQGLVNQDYGDDTRC